MQTQQWIKVHDEFRRAGGQVGWVVLPSRLTALRLLRLMTTAHAGTPHRLCWLDLDLSRCSFRAGVSRAPRHRRPPVPLLC